MSIKLTGVSFGVTPRVPGVRSGDLAAIDCDNPPSSLKDWRIAVRNQSVFFISPPGWLPANAGRPRDRDPQGPSVVHEVPRSEAYLQWQFEGASWDAEAPVLDTYFKDVNKHTTPPLGWKPAPIETDKPILPQIPAGQVGDA